MVSGGPENPDLCLFLFFFWGGGGGLVRKLYDPFLWMRFDYPKAAERLRGDSLHFTINSPGIPSTYLIELVMMKG